MSWIFKEDSGLSLTDGSLHLSWGSKRDKLRSELGFKESDNLGRYASEDNYEKINGSSDWLRLSFNETNDLKEIEVLSGCIIIGDVEVQVGGILSKTIEELKERYSCDFEEGDYGFTEFSKNFDLGDSLKSGGDNNKIAWFYTAEDLSHLKE